VIDNHDWIEPAHDVEALVRAAGEYVRASDDLRPRVLEAARLQSRERQAQRWIRHVAVLVVAVGFATAAGQQALEGEQTHPIGIVASAGFDDAFAPTGIAAPRSGDGDWRMFEAFTKLRQQQAQLLRFAL
jgi:hypothetical protein